MTAIGFFGYNGFGEFTKATITMNVPKVGFYSVVNVCLMLQAILGHSIAMYVVFDMFFKGFSRKFTLRFPNVHKQVRFTFIVIGSNRIIMFLGRWQRIPSILGVVDLFYGRAYSETWNHDPVGWCDIWNLVCIGLSSNVANDYILARVEGE